VDGVVVQKNLWSLLHREAQDSGIVIRRINGVVMLICLYGAEV
jgi:hypothetical protein